MEIFGLSSAFDPNDLIETDLESETDDIDNDETFTMSQKEVDIIEKQDGQDDEEMGKTAVPERKRKRVSNGGNDSQTKKKDLEYQDKKKIAQEVSKYPNLFDICNPLFSDKTLTQATWNKVSTAVDLPVSKCVSHWTMASMRVPLFGCKCFSTFE